MKIQGQLMLVVTVTSAGGAEFDVRFDGDNTSLAVRRPALDPAVVAGCIDAVRGDGTPESSPDIRAVGRTLFNWLFGVEGKPLVEQQREPIRLAVDDPVLSALPWELMRDEYDALVAKAYGLTRVVVRPASPPISAISEWPIRMMVVIGCSDADEADPVPGTAYAGAGPIGAASELRAIRSVLIPRWRSIDLEVVRRPQDSLALGEQLRLHRPHVLHFIGHGNGFGTSGLLMEPDGGPQWTLDENEIRQMCRDHGAPALVFLNTCRSAAEQGPSSAVSSAYIAMGTAAVIAMQGDVQGELARLFATECYRHLFGGWSERGFQPAVGVGKAVHEARRLVAVHVNAEQSGHRAPAMPVLTVRLEAARAGIPALLPPISWPCDPSFESCAKFKETMLYADAQPARRELIRWFFPLGAAAAGNPPDTPSAEPPVLVLHGEAETGKSFLSAWSMRSYAGMARVRIRHVAVDHSDEVTFLGLLRQIHNGEPGISPPPHDLLLGKGLGPHAAFDRFNWHLANLVRTNVLGEWPGDAGAQGSPLPFPVPPRNFSNKITDEQQQQLCAVFLDALEGIARARILAGEGPLLIAFDNFTRQSDGKTASAPAAAIDPIIRHIVLAAANRWSLAPADAPAPALRFMIACRTLESLPALRDKRASGGGHMQSGVRFVELTGAVDRREFVNLAREMYWFTESSSAEKIGPFVEALLHLSPAGLASLPGTKILGTIKKVLNDADYHRLAQHMQ